MRSFLVVLSVFGAVQCTILAVGFAGSRSTARRVFVLLASALVIVLGGAAVMESAWVHAAPHLYGASYGTRLALAYAPRYPRYVRTITVKSPMPALLRNPLRSCCRARTW